MPAQKKYFHEIKTPTYWTWGSMKSRCYYKKDKDYANYGGRGITVCKEWLESYDNFVFDMGIKPANMTIDRIDSNGNYEPSNCRWVSMKVQQNNRRNNVKIIHDDKNLTLSQWAEELNIKKGTLRARVQRDKIPIEKAFQVTLESKAWKHGTNNGYNSGCRCKECTEFNANKSKKYRLKVNTVGLSKQIDPKYHGTRTGYELYKCRCILCSDNQKIKNSKYREKQKRNLNDT